MVVELLVHSMMASMQGVDKKLNQVIDNKRQAFPRLFFMPMAQFKDMLVSEEGLEGSSCLSIVFTAVQGLIEEGKNVVGVRGEGGEEFKFKQKFEKRMVWDTLKEVEFRIGKMVSWELSLMQNKQQKFGFGKHARVLVEWTGRIEEAISKHTLPTLNK